MAVDDLARALRDEIAGLVTGACVRIIEFGVQGIVAWEVRPTPNGTLRAWYWQFATSAALDGNGVGEDPKLRELLAGHDRLLCVINSMVAGGSARIFEDLQANRPGMRIFTAYVPVQTLLREAVTEIPLPYRYELVVLRRGTSGRAMLDGHELFAQSTPCGEETTFTVRCDPGDEHGTVFAVVATEGARSFRLVSAQRADVGTGIYEVTARLVRPGLVHFFGLPAPLEPEHRRWPDLVASIPRELAELTPAHLTCAIEVTGSPKQVADRVDRVRALVRQADDSGGMLRVSLITYGGHSFDRTVLDELPVVVRWGETRRAVLAILDSLGTLNSPAAPRPPQQGYHKAAQIECVLALLTERLAAEGRRARYERQVLVTAGVRPPFPPRVDPRSTILPCPRRNDWREAQRELMRTYPDIAFGAIYDDAIYPQDADGEIWRELGATALHSGKFISARGFAADLKLRMSAAGVPFPLAETGGS